MREGGEGREWGRSEVHRCVLAVARSRVHKCAALPLGHVRVAVGPSQDELITPHSTQNLTIHESIPSPARLTRAC